MKSLVHCKNWKALFDKIESQNDGVKKKKNKNLEILLFV